MKKLFKVAGYLLLAFSLFITAGLLYLKVGLPNIPLEEVKVEITPRRVERGKYLAHHVAVCMDCHSTRDWSKYSGPLVPGTEGKGGELFNQEFGFPGVYYSANITPANTRSWTDGQLYRIITSGVTHDGRAMFPVMPYPYYAKMDKEDIYSIIAYIRTLEPKDGQYPPSVSDFPVSFLINTFPCKPDHQKMPPVSDIVAYGKYVTNAAGCVECHTPSNQGQIMREKSFSGGRQFELPTGMLTSPNITPDKETGIGHWTKEAFINRFKSYDPATYVPHEPGNAMQTIMPWTMYAGMTEEDLGAIYAYLQSLPPVSHQVEKFVPRQL